MQYVYDNFILRRAAEGRIFHVNPRMPFEFFINCFNWEQPFFMIAQLEDGRVSLVPNVTYMPYNLFDGGFWVQNLLPTEYEYVTIKNETYPVIVSAHPVASFDEWFKKFEMKLIPFAKQTLSEFVACAPAFQPLRYEGKFETKIERSLEGALT